MADEQESQQQKSGRPAFSAPLWAAARQGAKELSQVLPAFPDSVRPVEEQGTLGNPTPQEVTQEKGTVYGNSYEQKLDMYAARGAQAQQQDRGMGMER